MNNGYFDDPTVRRFWSFVSFSDPESCWPWTARTNRAGYGIIKIKSRPHVASRVALAYKMGRLLSAGELALHDCDNPPCCNPNHLHVGDHALNRKEAYERGLLHRFGDHSGELNPRAKLTWEMVREIRAADDAHGVLAREYGVSLATIGNIKNGRSWRE